MSIKLNLNQARQLLDFFGGEDAQVTVSDTALNMHSGPGLYAWLTEHPDEGSIKLDGLAAFVARVAPETQSPPEGGEGLASQKATPVGCPSKQGDSATLRNALQQIADMDPKGVRADDLGRAARIASNALGVPAAETQQEKP